MLTGPEASLSGRNHRSCALHLTRNRYFAHIKLKQGSRDLHLLSEHFDVTLRYIKAHAGHAGNVEADRLAKLAVATDKPPVGAPIPNTSLKMQYAINSTIFGLPNTLPPQ